MTRVFTPEDFGALSLCLTLAAILAPFATLKLDNAILLPVTVRDTQSVAWACVLAVLVFSSLLYLSLFLFPISGLSRETNLMIPLLTAATGWLMLMRQLNVREKRFATVAGNTILQSASISAAQLGSTGLSISGTMGLVGGATFGTMLPSAILGFRARQYLVWTSLSEIVSTLRRFWRFPLVFSPSTSLVLLAQQAPLLVMVGVYGVSVGGQLGVAERIVAIPVALLGLSIGQVFDAHLAERIRRHAGGYLKVYVRASAALLVIGVGVFLFFWLGSTWLLPRFLGDAWYQAGEFARVMSFAVGVRMVVNPLRRFVVLFERAGLSLWLDGIRVLVIVGVVVAGLVSEVGPVTMASMMFGALALMDIVTWLAGTRVMSVEDRALAS